MAVLGVDDAAASVPPPYVSDPRRVQPRRHEEYYYEDGNLVIQVYDILFKVWDGSFRRHSKFFEQAPTSLLDIEKMKPGSNDEYPWVLEGIEVADFERLLWIVYPPVIGDYKAKTTVDWIAVLNLSTLWKFKDIRELAIRELAKLDIDPVEKIELQQKYKIKRQWAYAAFISLCSRAGGLDVIEGRQLGVDTVIRIAQVREKLEKWGRKRPDEVRKVVCEILELEPEGDGATA